MKSFKEFLIEGGQLNARWANWLTSVNTEHPNPVIEPSYNERTPKEPGTRALRELLRRKNNKATDHMGSSTPFDDVDVDVPPERVAFAIHDYHGNALGGFFSASHTAKLINTKTGQQKLKPNSLIINSNRSEEGDLEFKISKVTSFGNEKDIHKYILPAGENLNGPWAQDSRFGHMQKPGASHVLSISDASRVIREHMISQIKTGKKDMTGQTVAQAHGVEF